VERRGSAFIQNRLGPNRVGPLGLLQLGADAIKFIWKEEFIPTNADKVLYFMAPVLALLPAALTLAAIPWGPPIQAFGYTFKLQITDMNIGIIYIFAAASLGVYGILTAGWSSGSKFAMLGALRASSQMISYEIAMGLSVVGCILLYGTLDLAQMTAFQEGPLHFIFAGRTFSFGVLPNWGVFYQPIAFVLFTAAGFAETNRLPFDLPEAEPELVAGYHTEYGGFKFNMFFMGEYGHMVTSSALISILFFGGFNIPYVTREQVYNFLLARITSPDWTSILVALIYVAVFLAKVGFFLWVYIWVRWTLPRFRYDQLMNLGWKTMLPWGLVNLALTATVIFFARG
jgi:NADH-quinone oxidoreductase subunit H